MQTIYHILLAIHIAAGSTALITGMGAIVTKKGGKSHRLWGKIYFWSMLAVVFSAMLITFIKPILFLFYIAIFSFYLCYSGMASIYLPKKIIRPLFRYTYMPVTLISALCGLIMIYSGASSLIMSGAGMNIVQLTFGVILSLLSLNDLKRYFFKDGQKKGEHILLHIGRMGGSYIATFTAFFVVNIQFDPGYVPWLLPTVIGTPLITIASVRWKKKLTAKKITKPVMQLTRQ